MQLTGLLEALFQTDAYRALVAGLKVGETGGLNLIHSASPYVIAALAEGLDVPVLVITARVDRAYNIAEQLPVWVPGRRVRRFMEPNPIFYERAPWGDAARRDRIGVLAELVDPIGHVSPNVEEQPPILVTSALALMAKTLPVREFQAATRVLKVGQRIDPNQLLRNWIAWGYEPLSIVTEPGTFSKRGGVIDIYPAAEELPVRIELFGDEIDSLRTFDPASQRSEVKRDDVTIMPAREALPKHAPRIAETLAEWFGAQPDPDEDPASFKPDFDALSLGTAFPFLEYYLPYMYTYPGSLLDYVPEDALVIIEDEDMLRDAVADLEEQALETRQQLAESAESADEVRAERLPPDFPLPYHTWDDLREGLEMRGTLHLAGSPLEAHPSGLGDLFAPGARHAGQLHPFLEHLSELRHKGDRTIILTRQAERLAELWASEIGQVLPVEEDIDALPGPGELRFVQGALAEGWDLKPDDGVTTHLLTDTEIFGWKRPEPRRHVARRPQTPESTFADLESGDYVVHIEYGIGRFMGLQKRTIQGGEREYLVVQYAANDKVYVPIHHADRLTRYVGPDETAPKLSRLGTADWSQVKARAQRAVEEIADELLELYAARETIQGHAFSPDSPWQHELEASFPYIETEDQLKAIRDVKADMEKPIPMDRLICGDVGYGKTEVALRAAFKAVMDGKQVAMLVPTTVLAQQHFRTFSERLASFPINVEMLSRFRTRAEQAEILDNLALGTVDIVIGTHRLIQPDVQFKNLGLLVIDEEQRFGVTHKERLKQMRTEVDVLTMTATPIPRTLYMGLVGIRDISMIQTAPEERLPVITHVGPYDPVMLRQAVLREIGRGGQVFFVHNRVKTIYTEAARLRRMLPDVRIAVGHGQMKEDKLAEVMEGFVNGEHDVLVSTSIIESGLDIPNANTLIVDRADWFGLAQLYQLRGRVGRSGIRAYAYFFHPRWSRLTQDSRARLETISEYTELGSGMSIAMRDLEIRGAGDILGTRQSGEIAAVGFHLYTQLLTKAVGDRTEGRPKPDDVDKKLAAGPSVTVDLPIPAYIPADYIEEMALRLQLYRRLADLDDEDAVDALSVELEDRFGPLPPPAENLLFQMRVRLLGEGAHATAITSERDQIAIKLPFLAHVERNELRDRLGNDVRVNRVAVWIPADLPDEEWQRRTLIVLRALTRENTFAGIFTDPDA